jgi:predicted component of type VI protein secretion system
VWLVQDLDSANGTWVNDADAPLASGDTHTLVDGDRLFVGAWTTLTVRIGVPAA